MDTFEGTERKRDVHRYGKQKALDLNPFPEFPFPTLENSFKY